MIQDLHAHTYYSFDSEVRPEAFIERAIAEGIQMLGISDHNYSVGCARKDFCWDKGTHLDADYGDTLVHYHDHISLLKEKYGKRIKLLSGLEVCTLGEHKDDYALPHSVDVSMFDYVLVENLDNPRSITRGDIVAYAKRCGCPVGIAHTDLFKFVAERGLEPHRYFRQLAEHGIFWEMNVNYDSLHSYRTHGYVTEFFKNKAQQEIVKRSGIKLSVGFDGHILSEYKSQRVKTACQIIKSLGIPLVFEHR